MNFFLFLLSNLPIHLKECLDLPEVLALLKQGDCVVLAPGHKIIELFYILLAKAGSIDAIQQY